jgi:hypothetical protein
MRIPGLEQKYKPEVKLRVEMENRSVDRENMKAIMALSLN